MLLRIFSFIIFFYLEFIINSVKSEDVCQSETCVADATRMKWTIDESADPCTDFYQYACGGYINKSVIPEGQYVVSYMNSIRNNVTIRLKESLEKPPTPEDSEAIKKAKIFYSSCMDTEQIENLGAEPLMNLLDQLGGWPVLEEDWDDDDFDWLSTLASIHNAGVEVYPLFQLEMDYNAEDIKEFRLVLKPTPIEEFFKASLLKGLKNKKVKKYLNVMVDVAERLGASRTDARKDLRESLKFEIELAQIIQESQYHDGIKISLGGLTEATDINWVEFFDTIFPVEIDEDVLINIYTPYYFESLLELLEETPNWVIANYIMWKLIVEESQYLDSKFRKVYYSTTRKLEPKERWEECVPTMTQLLKLPVASLYVRDYVDPETKTLINDLVENLRKEFEDILNHLSWMDDETRQNAIDKLLAISKFVAYPKELLNDELVSGLYSDVELKKDEYFFNVLILTEDRLDKKYSRLYENTADLEWQNQRHSETMQVNAEYYIPANSINIPAGILQSVFFDKNRPNYMIYGSTGYVLGHEITHGFDTTGRFYDKEGDYLNWWDEVTNEKFENRTQCLKEQYDNFTLPGTEKHGDSDKAIGEYMADNGGIKEAYSAYQKWVQKNGPEPFLPDLSLNQNQIFWLSSAMVWCEKSSPTYDDYIIKKDVHGPNRFRINGPMMNIPAFAEDYNCPAGSPMNPYKRCSVW